MGFRASDSKVMLDRIAVCQFLPHHTTCLRYLMKNGWRWGKLLGVFFNFHVGNICWAFKIVEIGNCQIFFSKFKVSTYDAHVWHLKYSQEQSNIRPAVNTIGVSVLIKKRKSKSRYQCLCVNYKYVAKFDDAFQTPHDRLPSFVR